MTELIGKFPLWFSMIIISLLVAGIVYRLVRKGVKIKVGPVEIDAEDDVVTTTTTTPVQPVPPLPVDTTPKSN